jgi:GT2 family glycosyltransferase
LVNISIIIVTYNPGTLLFPCLESLAADALGPEHEVILVDNASQDNTIENVRRDFSGIQIIANPNNGGFATAVNQGLALANGKYLLLLNPDAFVKPDTLSTMQSWMENHPDAGITGPRIRDENGHVALTAYPAYTPLIILWQYWGLDRLLPYTIYGRYRARSEQAVKPFEVETVQGSCFMIRREVYEQIGGLDESFFLFCEEPDYCERARSHGWRVFYLPLTEVTHLESSTVSRYTTIRIRSYHLCPLVFFRKRNRPVAVLILKLGFTFELLAKTSIRLIQIIAGRREFIEHVSTYLQLIRDIWKA